VTLPPFPTHYRSSGVLLHVTSPLSSYGIGDVAAGVAWIDRLHEAGQGWWQALPLRPTGYGDSPLEGLRDLTAASSRSAELHSAIPFSTAVMR
jgi:4-alpha-glucanotransferase